MTPEGASCRQNVGTCSLETLGTCDGELLRLGCGAAFGPQLFVLDCAAFDASCQPSPDPGPFGMTPGRCSGVGEGGPCRASTPPTWVPRIDCAAGLDCVDYEPPTPECPEVWGTCTQQ